MYEGLKNLEVPRAPKQRGARRVMRYALVGLLAFALFAVSMGTYTYFRVRGNLQASVDKQLRGLATALPNEPLNILVLGSDSREGITRADRRLGLGGPGGQRADVIMVLHIYAGGEKAALVSLPRDLRVEIPGRGMNRINAAYAFGGRNLTIRTVKRLTGLEIHHFVEVNFFGFRGIVNAVGGVPIVVDRAIDDEKAKLHIPEAGCWVLNGDQALAYVRARGFDPTADIGRIQRQQGFLRALAKRIRTIPVLLNPAKLDRISGQIAEHVGVDEELVAGATFPRARSIAAALATLDQRRLDFRTVPSYGSLIGGVSYLIPFQDQMESLFRALRESRPLPNVGKTSASVPERADVRVQVLNGTNRSGLATRQSARLANRGFQTVSPGNADRRPRTVIRFRAVDALKADLVARFYDGARMRQVTTPLPADVQVIVGRNFLNRGSEDQPEPEPAQRPEVDCRKLA